MHFSLTMIIEMWFESVCHVTYQFVSLSINHELLRACIYIYMNIYIYTYIYISTRYMYTIIYLHIYKYAEYRLHRYISVSIILVQKKDSTSSIRSLYFQQGSLTNIQHSESTVCQLMETPVGCRHGDRPFFIPKPVQTRLIGMANFNELLLCFLLVGVRGARNPRVTPLELKNHGVFSKRCNVPKQDLSPHLKNIP